LVDPYPALQVFGGPVAAFDLAALCCGVGAVLLILQQARFGRIFEVSKVSNHTWLCEKRHILDVIKFFSSNGGISSNQF